MSFVRRVLRKAVFCVVPVTLVLAAGTCLAGCDHNHHRKVHYYSQDVEIRRAPVHQTIVVERRAPAPQTVVIARPVYAAPAVVVAAPPRVVVGLSAGPFSYYGPGFRFAIGPHNGYRVYHH
jgi:hypothetical protein